MAEDVVTGFEVVVVEEDKTGFLIGALDARTLLGPWERGDRSDRWPCLHKLHAAGPF